MIIKPKEDTGIIIKHGKMKDKIRFRKVKEVLISE